MTMRPSSAVINSDVWAMDKGHDAVRATADDVCKTLCGMYRVNYAVSFDDRWIVNLS